MRPDSVPRELYEVLLGQLTQALQAIAALAPLTDEEVKTCRRAHGEEASDLRNLDGWAESMRTDMLAPGEYGRDALIDMLSRHEFLTNSHAGFIYGAFEGPQITYEMGEHAHQLAEMIQSYVEGNGPLEPRVDRLSDTFAARLHAEGVPDAHITYLLRLMGTRIALAACERLVGTTQRIP